MSAPICAQNCGRSFRSCFIETVTPGRPDGPHPECSASGSGRPRIDAGCCAEHRESRVVARCFGRWLRGSQTRLCHPIVVHSGLSVYNFDTVFVGTFVKTIVLASGTPGIHAHRLPHRRLSALVETTVILNSGSAAARRSGMTSYRRAKSWRPSVLKRAFCSSDSAL
jgi:hypothetical protein